MVDQHDLMEVVRDVEDTVAEPFDIFTAERGSRPSAGNPAGR